MSNEVCFTIKTKPTYISLECPHCESDIEIAWRDLDVPSYWGDRWEPVDCPYCGGQIELGEHDYE